MKRALTIALAVSLCLPGFLFGCGKTAPENETTAATTQEQTQEYETAVSETGDAALAEWEYEVYQEGELKGTCFIEVYNGTDKTVKVPAEIDGIKVTGLGGNSFYWNEIVEEVYLPSTVVRIAPKAFYECEKLKKIEFNDELKFIGEMSFAFCKGLTEITLPRDLETIGLNAFSMCTNLSVLNFDCIKLKEIGEKSFSYTAIKRVTIPDCVTFIDDSFTKNDALEYAYVPPTVTEMDDSAFGYCPNVVIHGKVGSTAEEYAKSGHIEFVAE